MISKNKLVEYLNDTIEHNSRVLTDLQNKREDAKEEYWKVALESLQRETQIKIWFASDLVDMIEQGEFDMEEEKGACTRCGHNDWSEGTAYL